MKKRNKKGFTLVELVIVIAVIAILAAVLIPNFARMVDKAQASSRLSAVESALKIMLVTQTDGALKAGTIFKIVDGSDTYYYTYDGSKLGDEVKGTPDTTDLKAITKTNTDPTVTIGSDTYTYAAFAELGNVTAYLADQDVLEIDGIKKTA